MPHRGSRKTHIDRVGKSKIFIMKNKKWITIISLFIVCQIFFIQCAKTSKEKVEKSGIYEMSMSLSNDDALKLSTESTSSSGNCCDAHGGSVGIGRQWFIATCKSKCETGIGFNCGGTMYLKCKDGSNCDVRIFPPNCPTDTTPPPPAIIDRNRHTLKENDRLMTADCIFLSNNTLKLIFQKPLPKDESSTKHLEVEDELLNEFPIPISLDKRKYKGFTPIRGSYLMSNADGKYGSVIINIKLEQ